MKIKKSHKSKKIIHIRNGAQLSHLYFFKIVDSFFLKKIKDKMFKVR